MSLSPESHPERSDLQSQKSSEIQESSPEDCAPSIEAQDLAASSERAVQRAIEARIAQIYGRNPPSPKSSPNPAIDAYLANVEKCIEQENYKKAIVELNQARSLAPEDSRIYSLLGRAFFKQGKDSRAKDFTERALALNYKDPIAVENFRLLLEKFPELLPKETNPSPRLGGASISPPDPTPFYLRRAKQAMVKGHYEEAIVGLREGLNQRHCNSVEIRSLLALAYLKQGNYKEAILELRKDFKLYPINSNIHSLLGLAYQRQNYNTMAKVHVSKALQLNPRNQLALKLKQRLEIDRARKKT